MDRAVLFGLPAGDGGEIARDGVVRPPRAPHEIQRHHGELGGGAPLQKQDVIVVRHAEQAAEARLGVLKDLVEHLGSVAHLHHGHPGAPVVGDLGSRPLQHLQRKHGGTGGKIVYTLVAHGERSFPVCRDTDPVRFCFNAVSHYIVKATTKSMPVGQKMAASCPPSL